MIKLGKNINNKDFAINFLAKINQRINDRVAKSLDINFWKYVKVLNLSDLRNGNSGEFSKEFETASSVINRRLSIRQ